MQNMRNIIITHGNGLNFYDACLRFITLLAGKVLLSGGITVVRPVRVAVKVPLTCTKTEKKNLTGLMMREEMQFEGDKGGKVIITH